MRGEFVAERTVLISWAIFLIKRERIDVSDKDESTSTVNNSARE